MRNYPCKYDPATQAARSPPNAIDNVVCVAAADQHDHRAAFSDYGSTLSRPGSAGHRDIEHLSRHRERLGGRLHDQKLQHQLDGHPDHWVGPRAEIGPR